MANISKRKVLVIAGVVACVFACAIVALLEFDSLGRPTPSGPSKGPSATAGYMIALGPLSAAWGFSMYVRCSDAKIRRWLVSIAALVAFWMLDVLLKYPIRGDVATALLWYCYYIPMTAIPTLCVLCAMRAASLDDVAWARYARRIIVAISVFAVFVVLTNNVHHLVFAFDFADPDWGGNYRYALGYYVLVAWYITLFVIFFATLFLSARRSLRSMLFPIGVIVGVGIVYGVMFTLRHVATLTSNVALSYCILAMAAIELTLDLGFFPSYAWYTQAFSKLPFDLKVLEANGDAVFETEMAQPMPQAAADILKTADKGLGESWAFRTTGAPHTLFKVYPVSGGRAVLAEDVAAIDERREALAATQERLRRSNAVLEREAEVQHEMWRLRSERELFVEIEKSLESKTRRIQMLLDSLPDSNDPDSIARRREMLVEVKLLVAYCKRKGALVLAEKSDPEFNRERLQLVFNETAADLRSIGVECAALVQTNAPLSASVVSVLYDCLYDFATVANAASDAVLMLFVQQDERRVQLRAMLDSSDAESERMAATFDELRASLEKHRVEYSIETDPSSASLVAYAPLPTKGGK